MGVGQKKPLSHGPETLAKAADSNFSHPGTGFMRMGETYEAEEVDLRAGTVFNVAGKVAEGTHQEWSYVGSGVADRNPKAVSKLEPDCSR